MHSQSQEDDKHKNGIHVPGPTQGRRHPHKKLLTSPLVVKPFNTKAHTIFLTDASRLHGLGFALMQTLNNSNKLSLVICGSKSLTKTQANYATVELEAVAILYAYQKCGFYNRGLPQFEVQTDHRPLEGVFKCHMHSCLLYTSPSPRDRQKSRMPSSA